MDTEKPKFTVKTDGFHGRLVLPEQNKFPGKALIIWGGSEGKFELSCMGAECFCKAERKYPQDSEAYKQVVLREMMAFLERW